MIGNAVICSNCSVLATYQPESRCTATDYKCPVCNTTDWDIVRCGMYTPDFIKQCINNLKSFIGNHK